MRISQIESQMVSNTEQMRLLQKQVAELSKSNNRLSELKESKLLDSFAEYIELGTIYNVTSYMYLTGVQTGVKDSFINPNFQTGDKIEFIKKNKKSFVIKCITKVVSKIETPGGVASLSLGYNNGENDIIILKMYDEYREEQKIYQKNAYYANLWNEKKIYN